MARTVTLPLRRTGDTATLRRRRTALGTAVHLSSFGFVACASLLCLACSTADGGPSTGSETGATASSSAETTQPGATGDSPSFGESLPGDPLDDGTPAEDAAISAAGDVSVGGDVMVVEDTGPETACVPGEKVCATPLAIGTCTDDGLYWTETACPDGYGCVNSDCIPQECTEGASTGFCLNDDAYEQCNASGTAWEIINCGDAAYCYQGACIPQLCTPGTKICKGFVQLQQCNASGDAWVDAELCPPGGSCWNGECLTPCDVNVKDGSYLGCEYWAIDLDNVGDAKNQVIGLVVSVPADGAGTEVMITNNATNMAMSAAQLGVLSTYLHPGQLEIFHLPLGFDVDGSVLTERTFQVVTNTPVAVHQFNPLNGEGVHTNDASLLLPSKVTGQEYFVMSWAHRVFAQGVLRGFVTIIATQPGDTNIVIKPSAPVVPVNGTAALTPGQESLFTLTQGQALNLETDGAHGVDLTGTYVWADQKVSVIGGHECANVPLGIDNCDHLEQQLYPVETWSHLYIADSFKPRSPTQVDVWRVMAGDNDVTVTTNPPVPGYEQFKLQRGGWIQFAAPGTFQVESDGPVMVGHYLTGSTYPGAQTACVDAATGSESAIGDPAFTLAVPVKRFLKSYNVLTPEGYAENYLNIVVPTGASVTIDGAPLQAPIIPIPGTGYGIARPSVSPGAIHFVSGTAPIGLTAYGYDCDVSYAYPGGMKLQAISEN